MTILDRILTTKREEVQQLQLRYRDTELRDLAEQGPPVRSFIGALRANSPLALIAEIKKASPSKGVIEPNFQPLRMAQAYLAAGAAALSILTDVTYFQGSNAILEEVRAASPLPLLRKDFVIDERQIFEARAIGADAILLIVAALPDRELLRHLYDTAIGLGMAVLVEVHTTEEAERAAYLQPALLGVNNRDLRTFTVDLRQMEQVASLVPASTLLVSESGIATADDVLRVQRAGAGAILVGETLMRFGVEGVAEGVRQLLSGVQG